MVHQTEYHKSWAWPLGQWTSAKDWKGFGKDARTSDSDDSGSDGERAFDIADALEQGQAREIVTDFMHPLRRARRLWRFRIERSDDKSQYKLFTDEGDFLLYAKVSPENRKINIHMYSPNDSENTLFDANRPAFSMTFNENRTEWRLQQEKCEHCQFAPKHLSCACCGKQQVALIKHGRVRTGNDTFNHMEIHVPSLQPDESRVIWCPKLGNTESQTLVTKMPVWNDEADGLVLNFKGRNIISSAKNFQLTHPQKPDHVICQFGKIGANAYSLDLRYPLSVIQAFGVSMTTVFWD
jgi:hypothetical protein|mmetsp:Transcript_36296/g.57765  ORF Transcript_36296/g.57765 Transcript_36296/m.57765 type:complete len:295 (+) Transcript_36296:77-961(+)